MAACFDNIIPVPLFVTSCITTSVRGCFGEGLGPVFKLGSAERYPLLEVPRAMGKVLAYRPGPLPEPSLTT